MNTLQETANYLISKKVPMVLKTSYENNKPVSKGWFQVNVSYDGRNYRANNKVIAKNMVSQIFKVGLGV